MSNPFVGPHGEKVELALITRQKQEFRVCITIGRKIDSGIFIFYAFSLEYMASIFANLQPVSHS